MLDIMMLYYGKRHLSLYFLYLGSGLGNAYGECFIYIFAKSQTKLEMPSFPQRGHESGYSRGKYFFLIQNLITSLLIGIGAIKDNLEAGEIIQKSPLAVLQPFIRDQSKAIIHYLVISLK
jgi:hypothetical protein